MKCIARTIKLTPDYSSIIHEIIDKFCETEEGYREFLTGQEQRIYQLFMESQSSNLRTLRSLIIDFERVYCCLRKTHYDEALASKIFYSFGAMLFEHKAGNYKPGKYGFLAADSEVEKKYSYNIARSRLITLQKWITEGEWDEAATCKEYMQRFCQEDMSSEDKFILWGFWDLNDAIVREGFPPALHKAYNGELTGKLLMHLITKIALARRWGIVLPEKVDYDKIEKGLKLRIQKIKDNEIDEPEHHTFITHEEQEVLNNIEKQLYALAYDIGNDLLSYLHNRRNFIDSMTNGDEIAIRQLKNLYYISFDQEMMDSLFARYTSSDVDIRRAIAHVIAEIHFKDFMKLQEPESRVSVDCLKALLEKMVAHYKEEQDCFVRILDQEFIKAIKTRVSDLEEKLQANQCKDVQADE